MKRLCIFLALLISATTIYAQTAAKQLEAKLKALHSFQANFEQIVYADDGNILQRTTGKLFIQRPGKFHWEVNKPYKQLVITDGQKMWFYDESLQQVTIRPVRRDVEHSPALLLSSPNTNITDQFTITKQDNEYTLNAKKSNADFKQIKLTFNGNHLKRMKLLTGLGQYTELTFSDMELNAHLPLSLFKFKTPKGVDVVYD